MTIFLMSITDMLVLVMLMIPELLFVSNLFTTSNCYVICLLLVHLLSFPIFALWSILQIPVVLPCASISVFGPNNEKNI
jgi:hypothetical protein